MEACSFLAFKIYFLAMSRAMKIQTTTVVTITRLTTNAGVIINIFFKNTQKLGNINGLSM